MPFGTPLWKASPKILDSSALSLHHRGGGEWLKPTGVDLKKADAETLPDVSAQLDSLLPPKPVADVLVDFYLYHFEHLHRVVHVPTLKKQYDNYRLPQHPRSPAIAALILSMMAISVWACPVGLDYQGMPVRWIEACDQWLKHQSLKYHRLVLYRILCLSYLAERINMIHKKKFWMEIGNLLQRAMMLGLHCDASSSATHSRFMIEMRRRVWHVVRELDLQNSYNMVYQLLFTTLNRP